MVQLYPSQHRGHAAQGGNAGRRNAGLGLAGEQPGVPSATAGPPGALTNWGFRAGWKRGYTKPSRVMKGVSSLRKTLVIFRGNYR